MNRTIFFLLVLLSALIAGCATHPNKNLLPYITGQDLDNVSADEIRANLTRIGFMAGGQYEFQVTPYTKPLIQAEVRMLAGQRGLSEQERVAVTEKKLEELYNNKTCIEFKLSVVRFNQVSGLKNWSIEIINEKGTSFPVIWTKESLKSKPVATYINGLYGKEGKWLNQGIACAEVSLPLEAGVIFKITPSYVQWPFPDSTTMSWGTAQEASYQDYRGY